MAAGAAAAATAGVAVGSFGYNRANFMYDAEMRFERFASSREYANQQSEQYRGDLRNLAALTVKKNGLWATTTTLCMALCVALYCAGRLGLHGPSPPAWIMGLWLTNNAAAFGFMALGTFLALHASFRAQAASVQLLTRKVRVPVPSLKQLDEARCFGSEFEQQAWGDIFRIPYLTNNGAPKTDDANYDATGASSAKKGRSSSAPPSRSKAASWVKAEFETDRKGSVAPTDLPVDAAPEHFRLYAAMQKEFYQHDIYARVCVFLGFIHYFQSLCFYGLGHINIELRAFWVAYGCVFVIAVLNALVLRFDIIPASGSRKHYLPFCEYFGPLAVLPAAIGMSLDFRVEFSTTVIAFTWVIIFIAYIMQLIYSLRILEIVLPDQQFEGLGERLGAAWLPASFNKVPSAFYHVLYFVAPPTKLQPGQVDLVREIKEGGGGAYEDVLGDGAASKLQKTPEEPETFPEELQVNPWKLVAAIAAVLPVSWCFLILGCLVDVILGEQALVTAPHWSRPPMTRLSLEPHELGTPLGFPWASGEKPWLPEQMAWHEEKRHAEEYSLGRRLSAVTTTPSAPTRSASELSTALNSLLETIPVEKAIPVQAKLHPATWPSFFEPRVLACNADGKVAALTSRGFGAELDLMKSAGKTAESFQLIGVKAVGPIVGAAWGKHLKSEEGLVLVSKHGDIMACPRDHSPGGSWHCASGATHGLPQKLPVSEGDRLRAVAVSSLNGELQVAISLEGEPNLVSLFAHDGEEWLTQGDIRVNADSKLALSFLPAGDLLIATNKGEMIRRRLSDGAVVASAAHDLASPMWQGACGLNDQGRIAHLRLDGFGMPNARMTPEVFSTHMVLPAILE